MTVPIPKQYSTNADDLSLNEFSLTVRLNDSLYHSKKDPSDTTSLHDGSSYRLIPKTDYTPPFTWNQSPLKGTGTFEIDGDKLTCYLQIKNQKDKAVILAKPMIRSLFMYYDKNHLLQAKHIECMLPTEASFSPNEERFYTFSVTLPSDHSVQYPLIEWFSVSFNRISHTTFFGAKSTLYRSWYSIISASPRPDRIFLSWYGLSDEQNYAYILT